MFIHKDSNGTWNIVEDTKDDTYTLIDNVNLSKVVNDLGFDIAKLNDPVFVNSRRALQERTGITLTQNEQLATVGITVASPIKYADTVSHYTSNIGTDCVFNASELNEITFTIDAQTGVQPDCFRNLTYKTGISFDISALPDNKADIIYQSVFNKPLPSAYLLNPTYFIIDKYVERFGFYAKQCAEKFGVLDANNLKAVLDKFKK